MMCNHWYVRDDIERRCVLEHPNDFNTGTDSHWNKDVGHWRSDQSGNHRAFFMEGPPSDKDTLRPWHDEVREETSKCEGNHAVERDATWAAIMPSSDRPSALSFMCNECVESNRSNMESEGWMFTPLKEVTP